jgi:hypothetical protein
MKMPTFMIVMSLLLWAPACEALSGTAQLGTAVEDQLMLQDPAASSSLLVPAARLAEVFLEVGSGFLAASRKAPLPEIHHFKQPGAGYSVASPLYNKQQEIKRLFEPHTPAAIVHDTSHHASAEAGNQLMPPVSTAMRCIINLVTQFFIVYTALFIVQTLNQLKIIKREREQKSLTTVAETVYFVPMLCVLFLAARMRAAQLAQGQTEQHGLPQWWLKYAMMTCTWSVLALTILVFVCTSLYGDMWEALAKNQNLGMVGRVLFFCRNAAMCILYIGFTVVCFGICVMPAPEALWGQSGGPPVSPAVVCTILLSVIYFAVYLALACARATNEAGLLGPPQRFRPTQELLKTATMTVAFVPMLCVLFIAARLRALQFDPKHGNPPHWMQYAFYVCTASLLAQAVFAIMPTLMVYNAQDQEGGQDGQLERKPRSKAIEAARLGAMAILYVGVIATIVGMFMMGPPDHQGRRVQLPPVLQCVVALTGLYFAVYLAFWVVLTLQWFTGPPAQTPREPDQLAAFRTFLECRAREAVRFCPIFCILFLGTLMRALQITNGFGAPQAWCQQLEVLATWCIIFLTFARLDTAFVNKPSVAVSTLCTGIQYICLTVLYVCATAVVYALVTMTPAEAAQGPGSLAMTAERTHAMISNW